MLRTFWFFVRRKQMLKQFTPRSGLQCYPLLFATGRYSAAGTSGHMGASARAVERAMEGARELFAAPTTAAAVYRAMVYRALSWS